MPLRCHIHTDRFYHPIVWRFMGLLFVICVFISPQKAQTPAINFINFSSKDGLSANNVNVIFKDRFGYMWFGTEDGLNKFDGETYSVYRHHTGDSTSIANNRITAICEDITGNLWIGTSESLSYYDRKKDAFVNYQFAGNAVVRDLLIDHKGGLWIGSYAGLIHMDLRTRRLTYHTEMPADSSRLSSNTIVSVFEDSKHRLWIGTNRGLHQYLPDKNYFIRYQHRASDMHSICDNVVRDIVEDASGKIWIATNDGGISVLQDDGRSFRHFRHEPANRQSLSTNRIFTIVMDQDGKLWAGTEEGINIIEPGSGKITRIANDPRNRYSLTDRSVRSIYIDKKGLYWVGTFQGGVGKYDKNLVFFNHRQSNPFDRQGLSSNKVTSFVEDSNGNIYVGTDGGGLNHFSTRTGLFSQVRLDNAPEAKQLSILSMEKVGTELWVGTYGRGIYIMDMASGRIRRMIKGNGPGDLAGNDIFSIKKDQTGKVWIGTNGQGVNLYDPVSRTTKQFSENAVSPANKLPLNGFIRAIEEDGAGNIWIGANGSGVAVYDPLSGNFRWLNQANSGLSSNNITGIYKDLSGTIWVGTFGGGLCAWRTDKGFETFSEKHGLANSVVYKILESSPGKLWVSTNNGVSCFDAIKKKFKNYSYHNGLQKSTFVLGSGLITKDGNIYFGGLDGFNFFDPATVPVNKVTPSLAFTDLKISNKSVVPGDGQAIEEHISVAKQINLDHKQNFSLDFVALNYTAPAENRYAYKLEGFDKDWNYVGTSRKAVYTNLDPGNYTFRLKASSDDGVWNSPETSIVISVAPPFWLTPYAYILYAFLIIGFLIIWRYWGIRRLKTKFALEQERQAVQQMIAQERNEADRQHRFDELKIKFLTNLSHEFRTPISLILGPLEKLLVNETSDPKTKQLTLVKRNARRLLNLVNQLLDFRKMEENELKLHVTNTDLVSFLKDLSESFMDISESRSIRFRFSSSIDHLYMHFDRDKIERVVFNLLSNAFKFTGTEGEVELKIEFGEKGYINIIVSDTGVGISPELQQKIFDRFVQVHTNAAVLNQGSGIGLSITREFVKLHGGQIHVTSSSGKGSLFTVSLPYCENESNDQHLTPDGILPALPENTLKPACSKVPGPDKLTVLLVEDNEDFRHYLKENLEQHYSIVEAADGKEGWQKVLSAHPQIVVSDITMPYMDGIQLSQKMKLDKRTRHIPVILLTALSGDNNHMLGLRTGAVDYLTKPFNFEILDIKIRNLLSLNQLQKTTYTRQIQIDAPVEEVPGEDARLLLKISRFIEDNIDNSDLTVEELSKHMFMSRGTLYSKMVELTGETPVEFIRNFRLKKAAQLLEHSDMKIAEIGYTLGFTTPNYFTRAFKAKFNISPSEYHQLKNRQSRTNEQQAGNK